MKAISARKSTIPFIGGIVISLVFEPSRMSKERGKDKELPFFLSRNICVFRVGINNVTIVHQKAPLVIWFN